MPEENRSETEVVGERPNYWWYKVYAVVVVVTALVIAGLGLFTSYFSR